MAFNDTLFQLGMDLTRSSPAQEEDHVRSTVAASQQQPEQLVLKRDGVRFAGTHLIVDLYGAQRLDDSAFIEATLKRCAEVTGSTLLHIHLHALATNGGVSGVAVLPDSHIAIRSWPQAHYMAVDVVMCAKTQAGQVVDVLRTAFAAREVVVKEHARGRDLEQLEWRVASDQKKKRRIEAGPKFGKVAKTRAA